MPVRVQIPTPMRQQTEGKAAVEVAGSTVQSALYDLGQKYPGITERIFDNGQVRRFVNVYINDGIHYLESLADAVKEGDETAIHPAVAGGEHDRRCEPEVPNGAAVFPLIPAELGVHPLLLAVLHAPSSSTAPTRAWSIPTPPGNRWNTSPAICKGLMRPCLAVVRWHPEAWQTFARQEKWPKGEGYNS